MYRLDRFQLVNTPICYAVPWARIVGDPPVVINKDGSIQTTFRYRGPDLDSATKEQLSLMTARLNAVFMSLDTGWVLFFESQRTSTTSYPIENYFPDPVTRIMDDERRAFFSGADNHFESTCYATLYWMPQDDNEGRLQNLVVEGKQNKRMTSDEYLQIFSRVVGKVFRSFETCSIPCEQLNADEMLTYLHSTVSEYSYTLKMPQRDMLLDGLLYDSPLSGGFLPKLGNKHMQVISLQDFSGSTRFGLLDDLNLQNFPYRWVSRYYCLEKLDAINELELKEKQHKSRFKSLMTQLKENFTNTEDPTAVNETAVGYYQEAKNAHAAVASDKLSYGYFTSSIIILADTQDEAESRAKIIEQCINNLGLKCKIEGFSSVDAYFGSLPGHVYCNPRRFLVSTGNLVHMMPLSSIWSGDARNKHLQGPPLLYTQTSGNTPYRLSLHVGDVGHTLVVGPTGAGKSVLLNTIESAFRKYKDARIFVFDKGASSYVLTHGVGGKFFDLGNETNGALSFQPLAQIDDERERQWCLEWLCDFIESQHMNVTPEKKEILWDALNTVASYKGKDLKMRHLTNLVNAVQDEDLKSALMPLTVSGAYGKIFDSDHDSLDLGSWQTFEMEKLMSTPAIVGPTLMYIFHRIEQSLNGEPTIIVLDECWVFFDNEQFAAKIREWLKVLRKSNTSVIFATQSINDIVSSPIFATVLESCPSRIFLPNNDALEEGTAKQYKMFGLNKRQIQIIATAVKKRQYYYVSPLGSRLFELALEKCPVSLAYVAVNTKDVKAAKKIIAEQGDEQFNRLWLIRANIIDENDVHKKEGA
jgi:type IV secretion system protein VirB4